jgi:hypothetical protein
MGFSRIAKFRFVPAGPYDFELTVRKPAGWNWATPYEVWEDRTLWSAILFSAGDGRQPRPARAPWPSSSRMNFFCRATPV